MTNQELKEWKMYHKQYKNAWHLSKHDWMEFIRLNHLLMEQCHEIHNKNMMEKLY